MSTQTISGRHRAVRNRERWLRLRSWTRSIAQLGELLMDRPWPFTAGGAFIAELLTPNAPSAVRTVHLERASIGYYRPPTLPTDRVRVVDAADECFGGIGFIAEFINVALPITVSLPVRQPTGGHRFERRPFSAAHLVPVVEVDRSAADTVVLDAIPAEAVSGRAS